MEEAKVAKKWSEASENSFGKVGGATKHGIEGLL
jgi:hypothetical protein